MHNLHLSSKSLAAKFALISAVLALLIALAQPSQTQNLQTLYRFSGGDGASPNGGLVVVDYEHIYGTCGDTVTNGTVFQFDTFSGLSVLHYFGGGIDGWEPFAGVALDTQGNLYGTTLRGGASDYGAVYEVTPAGAETVLHSFPYPRPPAIPGPRHGADGAYPVGSVVFDPQGNLYGTTSSGGLYSPGACTTSCGTVFKMTATGAEKLIHIFTGAPNDGSGPNSLIMDTQGNFYGVTSEGGTFNSGTVFKVTSAGDETVLYNFANSPNDGADPGGNLLLDAQGNLYGATSEGGAGYGIVFKLTPAGVETVLHSFTNGADGSFPSAPLAMDAQGNLYGSTGGGGTYGYGAIYELSPSGTETVLYSFTGGSDGMIPTGVVLYNGSLFGTTVRGGNNQFCLHQGEKSIHGCGTVFVLTP
jgi:uncharacterized repeat protein (TIGR03803 family)